jgi:cell division transport system ATP-binding protein
MISFDQVTVRYPFGNIALNNASFEVQDNEFIYLVGPSGAGKTTILKLLLHQIAPTSGSIIVDDLNITSKNFKYKNDLRRKIGVVFQDFKILPERNIYDNIAMSLSVKGYPPDSTHEQVMNALELVNLTHKEQMFPAQLSAGELQRVAIARAIVGDRSIILADEPTGNLDPKTTWEVMKIFKKLEETKTIIFATHNVDIVNSMKRRVLVVKDGEIIKDQRKGGYEL